MYRVTAAVGSATSLGVTTVRLSVNVNKIATLRNSRTAQPEGADRAVGLPSVVEAARVAVQAGAPGITVHPRADARHITPADVRELAQLLAPWRDRVEYNLEGDPRPDFIDLVAQVRPHQVTLVPVVPNEITSQAGWPADTPHEALHAIIERMHTLGVRVSLFVDPEPGPVAWAAQLGADRVELFTEPYAQAYAHSPERGRSSFERYIAAAQQAHALGLGINAGHDLDLDNLELFRELPHLDEVSIGHALVGRAVFEGLAPTVKAYLAVLEG
jgi:pyridoxine 5-phosphate synthase